MNRSLRGGDQLHRRPAATLGQVAVLETHTLTDDDIYATNSYADQDRVRLVPRPPHRGPTDSPVSWTAIAWADRRREYNSPHADA